MPNHGIMGWLAGGATVPGRALIDVLPFVEQMVLVLVSWHVGLALATGAEMPAATAKLTISNAAPRCFGMGPFPSVMGALIRGTPIRR